MGGFMTDLERDLFSLISLVSNVTEAYSACLFLENKRRGAFQLTSYHSLSPHIVADATIETGQGFLGWVLENNEPLSVDQFNKDTIVLGYYDNNEDIKSFMATPIPATLTRGALAVDSKKAWRFTPKSQKILAGFAQQFAHLVDGALAAVQRERRSLDAAAFGGYLHSLRSCESEDQLLNAICLVPRELLPFDGCFLVLKSAEGEGGYLVRTSGFEELFLGNLLVSDRASVAGYVLSKEEPLRLPDLKGGTAKRALFQTNEPLLDVRSVTAVPLKSGRKTIGVLGFTGRRRGQFDASAIKMAEILAAPVADALDKIRSHKKLKEQEGRDFLTSGHNLRYLNIRLREIIADASLRGRQVSLLSIFIDEVHEFLDDADIAGEEALILHVQNQLLPFGQGGDILARHEGAKFFLLLQNSSLEYAEATAEKMIHAINENPFVLKGHDISLTASVGVACYPEDETEPEGLFTASLKALTSARSEGINQLSLRGDMVT